MDINNKVSHNPPIKVRVMTGGRFVIPADVRHSLGIKDGDELLLSQEDHSIRMSTIDHALKKAQSYFKKLTKPGESVVDEFLDHRREEATKEESESRGEEKRR